MADKSDDYASLQTLKRRVEEYWGSKAEERKEATEARRYYHGCQWTAEEIKVLRKRRQPVVTYNREAGKVDGVVGLMERLRQDPKAFSRTPERQEPVTDQMGQPIVGPDGQPVMKPSGAEIATYALNYVLDSCDWRSISAEVARDGAIEAVTGLELSLEPGDHGDADVRISILDAQAFFYDPRSTRPDLSDARWMGIDKWMDADAAAEMFPDHEQEIEDIARNGDAGSSDLMDTAREKHWTNTTERKIRIVEMWYKKRGEWRFAFYTGSRVFMEGDSPFVDEKGRTFPRYICWSMAIDHEGDRYGFHRSLKSPQDEINHRRSKGLHGLNTKRIYARRGMVGTHDGLDDIETLRDEAHRPDGIILYDGDTAPEERSNAEQVSGNLEMLAEAKAEIDNYGANPALVGATDQKSGRAMQYQQQAAVAQLGPYIVGFRSWKLRVYRAIWNIIQREWTAERWIRVTDDEGLAQYIQINGAGVDPMTGVPTMVNALGALDVDIIIDEGPDSITLMQDVFETLMSLAQAGVQIPPEAIIEMSGLPGSMKKKLLGMIQQAQAQAQQVNPLQQAAARLELQQKQADVEETKARTVKTVADAHRAGAETERAGADAQATKISAVRDLMAPPEMPPPTADERAYLAG